MVIASAWKRLALLLLASSPAVLAAADDPRKPPANPAEAHQREAAEVAAALRESWPDHPGVGRHADRHPRGGADGPGLRLVPHGQWRRPASTGTRRASASTATATVGSTRTECPAQRRRFRSPRPQSRRRPDRRPTSISRAARWPPRPGRCCSRASIATATARSRATSSRRSSGHPTAAARASCRSPSFKRRSPRPTSAAARVGPPVEGDARPRPLPPGDRLARAGAEARRISARLHPEDQRRQGRGHALEADRPQAGRPGLRQLHLRAVPQPGRATSRSSTGGTRTARRS